MANQLDYNIFFVQKFLITDDDFSKLKFSQSNWIWLKLIFGQYIAIVGMNFIGLMQCYSQLRASVLHGCWWFCGQSFKIETFMNQSKSLLFKKNSFLSVFSLTFRFLAKITNLQINVRAEFAYTTRCYLIRKGGSILIWNSGEWQSQFVTISFKWKCSLLIIIRVTIN